MEEKICGKCGNNMIEGLVLSFGGEEIGAICIDCEVDKTGQVDKCSQCGKEKLIVLQDTCFADRWCEGCLEESRRRLKTAQEFYRQCERNANKS